MYFLFMQTTIGQIIRDLRKAKGWTQVELAQKLKASQKVITTYENNQRTPTLENLKKLAAVFNVSLDELVGSKKVQIQTTHPHLHRNSRVARIQDLYEQLPSLEQRSILKQIKALVATSEKKDFL
jgi:transcriptional regulator with XRE-family HTH domain